MGSIYYLDHVNGISDAVAKPLGWWSVDFTAGLAPAPVGAEIVTQGIATAKVTVIGTLTGGSWALGTAAGTLYFYGKSGTFAAGLVTFAGGGQMTIAGDFTYCAWKTITLGATSARTAAGDTIRLAKSPVPVSIGNATWTNQSRTVTLAGVQTQNIDMCETTWTPAAGGDTTPVARLIATDGKEGTGCMEFGVDSSPQANILQAYFPTGLLNLAAFSKISFWIKNQAAIADATTWELALCTGADGTGPVDVFPIPAIPSTARWLPLTIARNTGGFLHNGINSIALFSKATAPAASKYIRLDDIIACYDVGLNLQSLISKNSAVQGGNEGFYGIQSINGTTVMLDQDTNTKAGAGKGYSGPGVIGTISATPTNGGTGYTNGDLLAVSEGTGGIAKVTTAVGGVVTVLTMTGGNVGTKGYTVGSGKATTGGTGSGCTISILTIGAETVPTYIRETIKTALAASDSTTVQECKKSGTSAGGQVSWQGGYDPATNQQDGETFMDGRNGNGYGLYMPVNFVTLNNLAFCRYYQGMYFSSSHDVVVTLVSNVTNCYDAGVYYQGGYLSGPMNFTNVNNNSYGIEFDAAYGHFGITITNANNNANYGVYIMNCSGNNTFEAIVNANNNGSMGMYLNRAFGNKIKAYRNGNFNQNYAIYFDSAADNVVGLINTLGNQSGVLTTGSGGGTNYLAHAVIAENTKVSGGPSFGGSRVYVRQMDNLPNYHWLYSDGGNAYSQAATRVGAVGLEWKLSVSSWVREARYPLSLPIARIAVVAGQPVVVTAYFKKDSALNVGAALVCRGGQIAGADADISTPCPNNITANLLSITINPTEAGVIEIEAQLWYLLANGSVTVDTITRTQS